MPKYYVYYSDDYAGDWDSPGFEEFETKEQAINFIQARMSELHSSGSARTTDMYQLIEGEELKIKPVETVTKIVVERR